MAYTTKDSDLVVFPLVLALRATYYNGIGKYYNGNYNEDLGGLPSHDRKVWNLVFVRLYCFADSIVYRGWFDGSGN